MHLRLRQLQKAFVIQTWLIKGEVRRFWLFWSSPSPLLKHLQNLHHWYRMDLKGITLREKANLKRLPTLISTCITFLKWQSHRDREQRVAVRDRVGGGRDLRPRQLQSPGLPWRRGCGGGTTMGPGPGREMVPLIVFLCDKVIWIQINLKLRKEKLFCWAECTISALCWLCRSNLWVFVSHLMVH